MTDFKIPIPELQITFYQRLQELRSTLLLDGLQRVVAQADIARIDRELGQYVLKEALQKAASWSIRGEVFFPVPYVLTKSPFLLGFYRLLLGLSQKQFYGSRYGFAPFKAMEDRGQLSKVNSEKLPKLCKALCRSSELLLEGTGALSRESVHELTLLTLGPQLRGGALNVLGVVATQKVFDLIKTVVDTAVVSSTGMSLDLVNAAGREVSVAFASDPDICIREKLASGRYRNLVAIEIKGGRDRSNVHNRIGEAEKSHQKAKKQGYVECWTIVGVQSLDRDLARRESPTTDRFYSLDAITDAKSEEHDDFREHLCSRLGVSD